jgi:hypothetical protein
VSLRSVAQDEERNFCPKVPELLGVFKIWVEGVPVPNDEITNLLLI